MKRQPLGQNYLIDEGIALEIIQHAGVNLGQHVLEIGPGKGILTALLLEKAKSLTAIEVDSRLCSALTDYFGAHKNFQLIKADALKYDYSALQSGCQVVSNLPYYAAKAGSYGLPWEEALRSITLSTAEILSIENQVGSLEVGKDATLFIADGDILDIRTQVIDAFIQGRKVDLSDRHKMLNLKYRTKYAQKGILK